MTPVSPTKFHVVEPFAERLSLFLRSMGSSLVMFYWAFFEVMGSFFLGIAAVCLIMAGVVEIRHSPHNWYLALPGIALGIAFFASARVRRFAWTALGLGFIWLFVATAALLLFLSFLQPIESPLLRVVVILLYVLPPLIGAALVNRARNLRS